MSTTSQIPMIVSDKHELRRCVMHMWKNYNGLGLNLKNSKSQGNIPHMIRDVDPYSPAQYAGVLNNDLIIKIGTRVVEYEKFDFILRLIKDQLKKEKKCDMVVVNLCYYYEFKKKNEDERKNVDYSSPNILSQIKYYESPLFNPVYDIKDNSSAHRTSSQNQFNTLTDSPEPRLCHLLTWPNYEGYGFFVAYNTDGCYVKTVEPNSPAQLGGLRPLDRIIEINSKQVTAKDREYIMKQINKHKMSQSTLSFGKKGLKSQSGISLSNNKSSKKQNKSVSSSYLTLLTVDPSTYKWLSDRRVEISTRNKSLRFQEYFTPAEFSLLNLMEQSKSTSTVLNNQVDAVEEEIRVTKPMRSGEVNGDLLNSILIKLCTIRRLKDRESEPLGFEMTKRGTQAHFISRIEPGSSAAVSGLCTNDYLIELNNKNIEQDENCVLREKIFESLATNYQFTLLTINKEGYDYCLENKISTSGFCQINNQKIQNFETPHNLSSGPSQPPAIPVPKPNLTRSSTTDSVSSATVYSRSAPRLCTLRKTNSTSELGLSIARMKNVNEHVINDVVPGSLAEQAGIKVNDYLLEVNGENVQEKSHVETVNKIIELARQPNMNINLLVAERAHAQLNTPPTVLTEPSPVLNTKILNDLKRAVSSEILNRPRQDEIYTSLSKATGQNIAGSNSDIPSINSYPEIKVCEFIGYPKGSQLGLIVTSDEYSHDVIKVGDDSPAYKAGLIQGDVIIAVNDRSVEGNPTLIEILSDFDENRPLKVLAASRYAYEWSKLLRICITEKDWPNKKKCSTTYISHKNRQSSQLLPDIKTIYSNTNFYEPPKSSRPITPREQFTKVYYPTEEHVNKSSPRGTASRSYPLSPRSVDQFSMISNLSRSAVDITADGQVLRMCTLFLDPSSNNPSDSEFGFDLVTKVGRQIGEYFIDTVDDDSPACLSGIKPGDRLIEVDNIEVRTKTFEEVVQLINEAKAKARLKLLVHPSVVINYGNPEIGTEGTYDACLNGQTKQIINKHNKNSDLSHYKSMPDICHRDLSPRKKSYQQSNELSFKKSNRLYDYDTIYKNNAVHSKSNITSKSTTDIYGTTTSIESSFCLDSLPSSPSIAFLRPAVRLCTLYRNDSASNIGFGVHTKPNQRTSIPKYLRVSIVNFKSPAYLAGLDAGDLICEINGRSTLDMSHDESLYFIKSSYEVNNYVKLLVLSEFCYNWLREHDLLHTLRHDHSSVFSYVDFLKANQKCVPRQCKVRILIPQARSFGFKIETIPTKPASSKQTYAHIIVMVERESSAYAAGLKKGDRILELNGINVEAENNEEVSDRIFEAYTSNKQLTLFVVDPDTDQYFKSKCIKLHSMLPIVKHITNFSYNKYSDK